MLNNEERRLVIKMDPKDTVLVALTDLLKNEKVIFEGLIYVLQDDVKAKHNFFSTDLNAGEEKIMYGVLVGKVQCDVAK